jgi:hypothetical protein
MTAVLYTGDGEAFAQDVELLSLIEHDMAPPLRRVRGWLECIDASDRCYYYRVAVCRRLSQVGQLWTERRRTWSIGGKVGVGQEWCTRGTLWDSRANATESIPNLQESRSDTGQLYLIHKSVGR